MLDLSISGLWQLLRFLPVLSWTFCSITLGVILAIKNIHWHYSMSVNIFLLFLLGGLMHGIVSHASNDLEDWRSGTDIINNSLLSGGSKVLKDKVFTINTLHQICLIGLLLSLMIMAYFIWLRGAVSLLFILIALWSTFAYTNPPLRLSYHPFLGEWLAAFPAVACCTVGTYYILAGKITTLVLITGIIHSLLSIGLLLHHHILDINADLNATPPKRTTAVKIFLTYGRKNVIWVPIIYFSCAGITSLLGIFFITPVFAVSFISALACSWASWSSNPFSQNDLSQKELMIMGLMVCHTILFSLLISY